MKPHLHSLADYKRALLIPLAIGLVALLLVVGVAELLRDRSAIEQQRTSAIDGVKSALKLAIERDSDKLRALLEVLARDRELRDAFTRRDRESLLKAAHPAFERLRAEHGITHYYFIAPDRRMFLRVQAPERHGDEITRHTLKAAERTGQPSSGLELGPMGVFTLRVVHPWTGEDGRTIGYIELGIEIDRTLEQLQALTGIGLYSLIEKKHVVRERWEAGMRMVGRSGEWDRLPEHVLVSRPGGNRMDALQDIHLLTALPSTAPIRVRLEPQTVLLESVPLTDAAGRAVGRMILALDVTAREDAHQHAITILFGAGLLIGLSILLLGDRVIAHVYARLDLTRRERDDYLLRAERDALTGLFRQDVFLHALADELRNRREGSETGVLMMDIDFFKQVNDTHGHRNGDHVLASVARLIRECLRPQDLAARYGGEEFAVILPGASLDAALAVSERIRTCVEQFPFMIEGQSISITLSVGVGISPSSGQSAEDLVRAADQALYGAKRGGRNRIVSAERA